MGKKFQTSRGIVVHNVSLLAADRVWLTSGKLSLKEGADRLHSYVQDVESDFGRM